jgi:hypothetical protein
MNAIILQHLSDVIGKIQFIDEEWCQKACETLSQVIKDVTSKGKVYSIIISLFRACCCAWK